MGNYYQQKKHYNKYNPTASFSDLDCYGKNYFSETEPKTEADPDDTSDLDCYGKNYFGGKADPNDFSDFACHDSNYFSENETQNNNQTSSSNFSNKLTVYKNNNRNNFKNNSFRSKPKTNNFFKSTYTDGSNKKEAPPLLSCFMIYFFTFGILGTFSIVSGRNIVGADNAILKKASFYTLLESPLLFLIWLFLKNFARKYLYESEMKIFALMSIFFIPLISIQFNEGVLEILNSRLDKSIPVPYYLKITRKHLSTHTNSKSRTTSHSYHIFLTSWNGSKDFECNLSKWEFDRYFEKDIVKVQTRKGYFGFEYYLPFSPSDKVDSKLFPKDTVFPLTEEEAQKIINSSK